MPPVRFYLWHQHSGDLLPNRAVGGMLKAKHTARSADQGMVAIHEIESSAGLRVEVCGMLLIGICAAQGPVPSTSRQRE